MARRGPQWGPWQISSALTPTTILARQHVNSGSINIPQATVVLPTILLGGCDLRTEENKEIRIEHWVEKFLFQLIRGIVPVVQSP